MAHPKFLRSGWRLWYDYPSCARATRALLVRLGCLASQFEGGLPGPELRLESWTFDEGCCIRKATLRQMQSDSAPRSYPCDLLESEAQAAPRLVARESVRGNERYGENFRSRSS